MSAAEGSYWMYHQSRSRREFIESAASWANATGENLYCLVAVSRESLPDLLHQGRRLVRRGRLDAEVVPQGDGLWKIDLTRSTAGGRTPHVRGTSAVVAHDRLGVYLLITHEGLEFIKLALRPALNGLFPHATVVSYSSEDLRDVLKRLQRRTRGLVLSTRLVATSKLVGEYTRRFKESNVKYTDESFEVSFEKARLNEQYVSLIDFNLYPERAEDEAHEAWIGRPMFEGHLARNGLLRCRGDFATFYREVVSRMAKRASEYLDFFDKRGRSEAPDLRPRPIEIGYDSDVLLQSDQLKRLAESLYELPFTSCSLFHGNPYLHASIVDYRDGSVCDVWVTSADSILLVPQLKSSSAFLERLCTHIFEMFKEGELREHHAATT